MIGTRHSSGSTFEALASYSRVAVVPCSVSSVTSYFMPLKILPTSRRLLGTYGAGGGVGGAGVAAGVAGTGVGVAGAPGGGAGGRGQPVRTSSAKPARARRGDIVAEKRGAIFSPN